MGEEVQAGVGLDRVVKRGVRWQQASQRSEFLVDGLLIQVEHGLALIVGAMGIRVQNTLAE
jgi:hypothetical protein